MNLCEFKILVVSRPKDSERNFAIRTSKDLPLAFPISPHYIRKFLPNEI